MNLMFNSIAWVILLAAVCGLFVYRRWLENHDDHYIHLHGDSHDANIVNSQTSMARRLGTLDKIKNACLAAVILYGLAIIAAAAYSGWHAASVGN